MPMPVTRPIRTRRIVRWDPQGQLLRTVSPGFNLPPSNGITLPNGVGELHTVKEPTSVLRPVAARVT